MGRTRFSSSCVTHFHRVKHLTHQVEQKCYSRYLRNFRRSQARELPHHRSHQRRVTEVDNGFALQKAEEHERLDRETPERTKTGKEMRVTAETLPFSSGESTISHGICQKEYA